MIYLQLVKVKLFASTFFEFKLCPIWSDLQKNVHKSVTFNIYSLSFNYINKETGDCFVFIQDWTVKR